MNSILGTIVCFLGILSVQLIYSLMLSDVEEKTYEFGMLRALGFNTTNVVHLIISQAVFFAVPGLLLGLAAANILNICLRHLLFTLTSNFGTYELNTGGYLIGVTIGIVMPLVSNIFPIQRALGKNLRQSLDLYQRSASELTVTITKLSEIGLSLPQLVMAVMLVVLGVLTYYVAPSAFLFGKFELFFFILNSVLLLMIIGLTFISVLVLPQL
jgi:hypothetical protein